MNIRTFVILFLLLSKLFAIHAQETPHEKPFKTIKIEPGFLLIPSNLIPRQEDYTNAIVNVNVYAKLAERWYFGFSTYWLLLLPRDQDLLRQSWGFHITGLFARYYPPNYFVKYFIETHTGVGDLCECPSNQRGSIGGIGEMKFTEGVFLGAGLGFDMKISPFLTLKPNVKAFYLLNEISPTSLHLRPLISFIFSPRPQKPPVINNPRF